MLGDIFYLKTYRLTFGLLLNAYSFTYDLAEESNSESMVQRVQSTFIYRLKLEPEEAAKMSASSLALYLNLTYTSGS